MKGLRRILNLSWFSKQHEGVKTNECRAGMKGLRPAANECRAGMKGLRPAANECRAGMKG